MIRFLQTAAHITTMWGLAGIAIGALLHFSHKQRGKVPPIAWGVVIGIVLLAIVPTLGWLQLQQERLRQSGIYHLRITVLDPEKTPINEARVWSSTDAIPKKLEGGWELSIPSGSKPSDGKLTVYAEVQNAFWRGHAEVELLSDYYPTITVQLGIDERAQVRGIVQDPSGRAVAGAQVSVVGYGAETFTTGADGNFVLPAHGAEGQQVQMHAEKRGYRPVNQWSSAGRTPATFVLEKR